MTWSDDPGASGAVDANDVSTVPVDIGGAIAALEASGMAEEEAARAIISQFSKRDVIRSIMAGTMPERIAARMIEKIAHAAVDIRRDVDRDALAADFGIDRNLDPERILEALASGVASPRMRVRLAIAMANDRQTAIDGLAAAMAAGYAADPIGAVHALGSVASALTPKELAAFADTVRGFGIHPLSVGIAGGDSWQTRRSVCRSMGIDEGLVLGISNYGFEVGASRLPKGFVIVPVSLGFPPDDLPKALPEGLHVDGSMRIEEAPLRTLPKGMVVRGELALNGCADLRSIPADLVTQQFQLWNCPGITHLPDADYGGLDIRGCHALKEVPRNAVSEERLTPDYVDRNMSWLFLDECDSVRTVRGGAYDCVSIQALPKLRTLGDMSIARHLWIRRCPEIRTIGGGSCSLGMAVEVDDCGSFRGFNGPLALDSYLQVRGCPSFRSLPEGLRIGRFLEVLDCPKWDGIIPEGAEIGFTLEAEWEGGFIFTGDGEPRFKNGVTLAEWRDEKRQGSVPFGHQR